MCGRYTLVSRPVQVSDFFGLDTIPTLEPRYNIAPGQIAPVLRSGDDGAALELAWMRWGLIPSWAKDASIGYKTINACCETVADKPAYRGAFRHRRCLIPADGFYEWLPEGKKKKQPYHFHLREGGLLAFAGLWEDWMAPDGSAIETFSVLTTEANDVVRPIHPRMPVILAPTSYASWLKPEKSSSLEDSQEIFHPYPSEELEAVAVDSWVNNARHEGPQCLSRLVELPFGAR